MLSVSVFSFIYIEIYLDIGLYVYKDIGTYGRWKLCEESPCFNRNLNMMIDFKNMWLNAAISILCASKGLENLEIAELLL